MNCHIFFQTLLRSANLAHEGYRLKWEDFGTPSSKAYSFSEGLVLFPLELKNKERARSSSVESSATFTEDSPSRCRSGFTEEKDK